MASFGSPSVWTDGSVLSICEVNLLEKRIAEHRANLRGSLACVRLLVLMAVASVTVLPYLLHLYTRFHSDSVEANKRAQLAVRQRDAVVRQLQDTLPAVRYAERLSAARSNQEQWLFALDLLEGSAGSTGFVTSVTLRAVAGGFEVNVIGEASSLTSVNAWISFLRQQPEHRDLYLAGVQPSERLLNGGVRYDIRGRVRVPDPTRRRQ